MEAREEEIEVLISILEDRLKIDGDKLRIQVFPEIENKLFGLEYLPPAILTVQLSENYPEEPLTSVNVRCVYKTDLKIEYEDEEQVIWQIYNNLSDQLSSLKEADIAHHFNKHRQALENYNSQAEKREFDRTNHECHICYSEFYGSNLLRCKKKTCNFCRTCLDNFLEIGLKEFLTFKLSTDNDVLCPLGSKGDDHVLITIEQGSKLTWPN